MKMLNKKHRSMITGLMLMIASLVFIISILSLSSCRSLDDDKIIDVGEVTAVNINLLGADYAAIEGNGGAEVSLRSSTPNSLNSITQHHTSLISPSLFLEAEMSSVGIEAQASSNKNALAVVDGNQIETGVMFRVIAYFTSSGSYQIHKDYIIGQKAEPLMLDAGKSYTIIVYSYGTSVLPTITSEQLSNIKESYTPFDKNHRDFMYQRINNYVPDGSKPNNVLNIKLRHKVTEITTTVNSLIGDINSISANIMGTYIEGKFGLNTNGQFINSGTLMPQGLIYSGNFPTKTVKFNSVLLAVPGSVRGGFSADVNIGGDTRRVELPQSFNITPEYKNNLTINLKTCGAYIAPGVWKDFMCHNLGADLGASPMIPSPGIHGAKYQFGVQTGEDRRYVSQTNDFTNNSVPWSLSGASTLWNSGTDLNPIKTTNDPCPDGFRVPTKLEWEGVFKNNKIEAVGPVGSNLSSDQFKSGFKIGTLFLPTAGYREVTFRDGDIFKRGSYSVYWTSNSINSVSATRVLISMGEDLKPSVIIDGLLRSKPQGYSIRCIAER